MTENKTLIRWVSGIIIVLLICFTLITINSHPYEIRIDLTTNDNFKTIIQDYKQINKDNIEEREQINKDNIEEREQIRKETFVIH